jgi:hypothetical protein
MSFLRSIQGYPSHVDPIWPDGTFKYSTFPTIKKIKDPGPLNSKNIFEQLNNNSCVQTGSCVYRRRKFRAGATYVWFYLTTGCIHK